MERLQTLFCARPSWSLLLVRLWRLGVSDERLVTSHGPVKLTNHQVASDRPVVPLQALLS